MASSAFYTVKESFVGTLGGHEVEYHKGEVVPANDPAVKKMPAHFEELVIRGGQNRSVEQATAAPGEKRRLSVRRKPRKATPAEEAAIAETIEAEAEPEPEEPRGHALTTADFRPRDV
jgi:hypothetical protein